MAGGEARGACGWGGGVRGFCRNKAWCTRGEKKEERKQAGGLACFSAETEPASPGSWLLAPPLPPLHHSRRRCWITMASAFCRFSACAALSSDPAELTDPAPPQNVTPSHPQSPSAFFWTLLFAVSLLPRHLRLSSPVLLQRLSCRLCCRPPSAFLSAGRGGGCGG